MAVVNNMLNSAISAPSHDNLTEDDLKALNRAKALSVDRSKVPAVLASKLGIKSVDPAVNIISDIISDSDNERFKNLNFDSLDLNFKSQHHEQSKDHMVQAPIHFGSKDEIPKELADSARSFSKNLGSEIPLELYLNLSKEIHEKNNFALSPKGFAELLLILLPSKYKSLLSNIMCKQNYSISEIFEDLSISFGSILSTQELITSVYEISKNASSLWDLAQSFTTLVDKSGQSSDLISNLATFEYLRRVSETHGISCRNMIQQSLDQNPRKNFRALYKVIKENYLPEFYKSFRKVHHVEVNEVGTNDKICYNCDKPGHFSKNCPMPRKIRSRNKAQNNASNQYCNQRCSIHKGTNHSNKDCLKQRSPCTFKESHARHSQGNCMRQINDTSGESQIKTESNNTVNHIPGDSD